MGWGGKKIKDKKKKEVRWRGGGMIGLGLGQTIMRRGGAEQKCDVV